MYISINLNALILLCRKIQLPNGLTALLISDGIPSSTDEASVVSNSVPN